MTSRGWIMYLPWGVRVDYVSSNRFTYLRTYLLNYLLIYLPRGVRPLLLLNDDAQLSISYVFITASVACTDRAYPTAHVWHSQKDISFHSSHIPARGGKYIKDSRVRWSPRRKPSRHVCHLHDQGCCDGQSRTFHHVMDIMWRDAPLAVKLLLLFFSKSQYFFSNFKLIYALSTR